MTASPCRSEVASFESGELASPFGGYGARAACAGIELYHNGAYGGMHRCAVGRCDELFEHKGAFADCCYGAEHFHFVGGYYLSDEVAVYVGDNESGGRGIESFGKELAEVGEFGHIAVLQVCSVVGMSEHVEVVETCLDGCPVAEFVGRSVV